MRDDGDDFFDDALRDEYDFFKQMDEIIEDVFAKYGLTLRQKPFGGVIKRVEYLPGRNEDLLVAELKPGSIREDEMNLELSRGRKGLFLVVYGEPDLSLTRNSLLNSGYINLTSYNPGVKPGMIRNPSLRNSVLEVKLKKG